MSTEPRQPKRVGEFIRRVQGTFHEGHRGPEQMADLWDATWATWEAVRTAYAESDASKSAAAWEGRRIYERDAADFEDRMEEYRGRIEAARTASPQPLESEFQHSIRGFLLERHPSYRHPAPDFAMPLVFQNMLAELDVAVDQNTFWRSLKEATPDAPETFGRWVGHVAQGGGQVAASGVRGFFRGTGWFWGLVIAGGSIWVLYEWSRTRALIHRALKPAGGEPWRPQQ